MTLRDDLIPVVDEARGMVAELGLRLHTVVVRVRTWDGGVPGRGMSTNVDTTLEPTPRVRPPSVRRRVAEPGRYEDGDQTVDRISATYTAAELDGSPLAAGQECLWLIDGEPHRVVGKPDERLFGWEVQLRRAQGRP